MSFITKPPKFSPLIKHLLLSNTSFRTFQTSQNRTNTALLGAQKISILNRTSRPFIPFTNQIMYQSSSSASFSHQKNLQLPITIGLLSLAGGIALMSLNTQTKQEKDSIIKRGNEIYETLLSQMPDKPLLADHRFREEVETNLSMRMLNWNMDTQELVMARHFIAFAESVDLANKHKAASQPEITYSEAYIAYKNLRAQLRDYKNTELVITDEHLTMLPLEIYFIPLRKLEIYAPISNLPDKLSYVSLTHLTVQSPCLTQFPKTITELSHLRRLNLSHNKITLIPHEISNLKKLEVLDLSFNTLSELPESMNNLKELEHLNLSSNQFRQFPLQLSHLQKLSLVNLENQTPSTS